MKVLIVNTSDMTGGAAVAAHRLMDALTNHGVKVKMLVRDKTSSDVRVVEIGHRWRQQWNFLWERWCLFWHLGLRRRHLFEIDMANTGHDITKTQEFKEADIIHLHWINQGFLSLKGIRRILDSGKPVVWTMHDMWPATAICHLTLGCEHYKVRCGECPYLPRGGSRNDLSSRVWKRKQRLLQGSGISFVTCSNWLASEARESGLFDGLTVTAIPNPIDTGVFMPSDKAAARKSLGLPEGKRLVLFVSQRVSNPNKGMKYLLEACERWMADHPEECERTAMVILGGHAEDYERQFPMEVIPLGYVSDTRRIVHIYNAVDVFVLPSLSENLPNTIMEAMACGVPCIGFRVGGIPEEIDHLQNGYVADYKDAADLANGLHWILNEADYGQLSAMAVKKVHSSYSQGAVARQYQNIYQQHLNNNEDT